MLSFAADFPLKSAKPDDLIDIVSRWVIGSPHTLLSKEDVAQICAGKAEKIESNGQSLELIGVDGDGSKAIGAKHTAVDGDLIYSTTLVGRLIDGETWVSIRTDRAGFNPQIKLREARKPQIIKLLLKHLGGGLDGELWVGDTPHFLKADDQNMAVRLLNGDSETRIPVVYLSRSFRDEPTCDPHALARHLGGLAHVVVEPSREFSRAIQPFTNSRNAYGGAVGIYLPTGQRSLILADHEDEWSVRKSASEVVRAALLTSLPLPGFSWADLEAERSRQKIEALKGAGSTDLEAYVREFDAENQALRDQNSSLASDLQKLKVQIQTLNATNPKSGQPIKRPIAVQDYFPGESEHFLRDAVRSQIDHVVEGSRRRAVLAEFFDRMSDSTELERRKKLLKDTLSTSDDLDAKAQKVLQELGFSVSSDGKHHKLVYNGDARLTFTMAKTSSDHRAGKNLAAEILRKIF